MVSVAYAMGSAGGAPAGGPGGIGSFVPLILMFVIFYFMLIRPQQKKVKEHREMVAALKKGDRIMTSSGFYGTIVSIEGDILSVELGDRIRVRIERSYVSQIVQGGSANQKELKSKSEDKN